MMKQYMVLRFNRVKNEAKMVVIFKQVKIEVISGFENPTEARMKL